MELLPEEKIVPIKDFPSYYVSNLGRVWSTYGKGRWLIPTIQKRGNHKRAYVSLGRGNKKYLHQLVAQAFLPNPLDLTEVDHIDSNGLNNRVENLQWVTHSVNLSNPYTQNHLKTNTGYYVEIREIDTGIIYYGVENAAESTGYSKQTILNHLNNKVHSPKWERTGRRINPQNGRIIENG